MCRFSPGVAALALAASGALAQNDDPPRAEQAGAEQVARQDAGQHGGPSEGKRPGNSREQHDETKRTDNAPPRAVDLRRQRENGPEDQVVGEILRNQNRHEERSRSQPVADSPEPPSRVESGLRDLPKPAGTERILERTTSGPLDRSARVLTRCPPGLARREGCQPPGQSRAPASQRDSLLGRTHSPLLFGLTGFDAGRYLYRGGYLLQLAGESTNGAAVGDTISGYIPLLGGALASGNIWPDSYGSKSVPAYLVDFYNLGQPGSYRYADNTLYRLDQQSGVIHSIAALLTDEEVAIGEPMPTGYDVYNVPYPYQDRYADSAEAAYRYVDGYVYQIDPATRLVTAANDLLT